MLISNAIDNGLACDCGVSRFLIVTNHRLCKKYFRKKMGCTNSALYLVYRIY